MDNLLRLRGAGLFATLLLLLSVATSCTGKQANASSRFSFKSTSGEMQDTTQFIGKPLVVNFWADWCPPCKAELPDLNASYEAHKSDFNMIAVSMESSQDPDGYWQQQGYTIPMYHDVDGASKFAIQYIPTTLFIDAQGNVVDTASGAISKEDFEQRLAKLLQ